MELLIQDLFEKYLKELNIKYKREYRLENSIIDFIANFDGNPHGVEVKSSYSNVYTAIGQLVGFSRYFSHLILVTTKEFLNNLNKVVGKTNILKQMGIIIFEEGRFTEIKKPSPPKHFFKEIKKPKKRKKREGDGFYRDRFTTEEEKFFKRFKDSYFMVHDMVKELDKSFATTYRFILTLRKLGFVEELSQGTRPKTFKITNKLLEMLNSSNQT